MDQQTVNQNVAQAQQQGQASQQGLDTQSNQLQGKYGQAQDQASQAFQGSQAANQGIQDAGQLYGQDLQGNLDYLGIHQGEMATAARNMAKVQNQIANAPLAAQQAGNYYGTTAGGTTNIYSGMMANLNPSLSTASNSLSALGGVYGQAQTGANQQAGLSQQSQQAKAQQANATYQQSVAQLQTAGDIMAKIQTLAQQQGNLTADQVATYQDSYSKYVTAKSAAAASYAQAALANSVTTGNNITNKANQQQLDASSATAASMKNTVSKNQDGTLTFKTLNGQPVSLGQYAQTFNLNPYGVLQQSAQNGDKNAQQALTFVGSDGKYDPSKINQGNNAQIYQQLFGNTYTNPTSMNSAIPTSNSGSVRTFAPQTMQDWRNMIGLAQ